jgi:hypothetical protein
VYIILVHKERAEYPKDVIIGKLTGDIGNQNIRLLGVLNGKKNFYGALLGEKGLACETFLTYVKV